MPPTPNSSAAGDLAARHAGMAPLATRGFRFPPEDLSENLVVDAAATNLVPPEVLRALAPPDGHAPGYADEIAARWLTDELGALPGDWVAVALLWGRAPGDAEPTLHAVLTLAQPVGNGHYQPVTVAAGSLRELLE